MPGKSGLHARGEGERVLVEKDCVRIQGEGDHVRGQERGLRRKLLADTLVSDFEPPGW